MSSFRELLACRRRALQSLQHYNVALEYALQTNGNDDNESNIAASSTTRIARFWRLVSRRLQSGTWIGEASRILFCTTLGHTIGILLYATTSLKFAIEPRATAALIVVAVEAAILGFLLLPLARALLLIALPSLLTARLRAVLLLLVVAWSFQTPATNIVSNIRRSGEGIACVRERARVAADETRQAAVGNLSTIAKERFLEFARDAGQPLVSMRETMRDVDEIATRMIAWQRAMIESLRELFDSCDEFMQLPYKRVCHSTLVLTMHCEWPATVRKQLEESLGTYTKHALQAALNTTRDTAAYRLYAKVRDTANETIDSANSLNVSTKYALKLDSEFNAGVTSAIRERLRAEVAWIERLIEATNAFLSLLIYPLFVSAFVAAGIYIARFHHGKSIDNHFINARFERIDARRLALGRPALLPLYKVERQKFIRSTSAHITKSEWRWLTLNLIVCSVSGIVPLLFALVDAFIYQVSERTYEFFRANTTRGPEIPAVYELKVAGEGFMSELLRALLALFAPYADERRNELWRECFVEPSPPDFVLFQLQLLVFVCALIICFVQNYAMRTRSQTATYYFPARAQPRAIHLYNRVLRERKNVLNELMQRKSSAANTTASTQPEEQFEDIDQLQTCARCSRADLTLLNATNTSVCASCNAFYCVDCYSICRVCMKCDDVLQQSIAKSQLYVDSSASDAEDEAETTKL